MKYSIPLILAFFFFVNGNLFSQNKKIPKEKIATPAQTVDAGSLPKLKDIRRLPRAPKTILTSPLQNFKTKQQLFQPVENQPSIKIIRDEKTGLPNWISGKTKEAPVQRTASTEVRCYNYLDAVKAPLKIEVPEDEFLIKKISVDDLGQKHIRMQQQFQGISVYGSEVILHEKNGEIYLLNGRYYPTPTLEEIVPNINSAQAHQAAQNDLEQFSIFKIIPESEKQFIAGEQFESELVIYHPKKNNPNAMLAYHVTVIPNLTERWEYFVDARNGAILHKHSSICKFHADLGNHSHEHFSTKNKKAAVVSSRPKNEIILINGPATANATDLLGVSREINTYEINGTYFLYDGSRDMFDANSQLPQDPKGMIVTIDGLNTFPNNNSFNYDVITSANNTWNYPSAISGHYNGGKAYEYFKNTHNRESINGNGGNILSFINISDENGGDMDNAFWNGAAMFYGNGNQAFTAPLAKSLDVAGHEMSHGVIQSTANLEYQGESGAMNESFADIFGAMIDRDDWQMGEDVTNSNIFPTGVLRDLQNPNNGGSSLNSPGWQPAHMNEFQNLPLTPQGDYGGVHINSGIVNRAYYVFATEIGKDKAERIYYKALNDYLVKSSQFVDLRNAVVQAAGDLYGNTEVQAANNAFTSVGIGQGTGVDYQTDVSSNDGDEFVLHSNANLDALYISDISGNLVANPLSDSKPFSKPSITDDGSIIVFVDDQNNLRFINIDWTDNSVLEDYIESNPDPVWANVTVAKDGRRIAANRNFVENVIYVYDFDLNFWQTFDLYNPTTSDPNNGGTVTTGEVQYADAMEFDFTGEYLMYDAFNKLENTFGDNIEYWDIGFLKVFDNANNSYGSGNIEKLFSGIPENVSIGNPTFAKNSPYIVAFDYREEGFFSTTFQILGANIETGDNQSIYSNDDWSYPNYSVDDTQLIFDAPSSGTTILGKIDLNPNKISAVSANAAALFPNGTIAEKWGTWFATGNRDLVNTNETEIANLQLQAFPNPFKNEITIELQNDETEDATIEVIDLLGRKVFQKEIQMLVGKNSHTISMEGFAGGTYFVMIKMQNTNATLKITKTK